MTDQNETVNLRPGVKNAPALTVGAFKPLVDKVGVPLLWFGLGLLAGMLFKRKAA